MCHTPAIEPRKPRRRYVKKGGDGSAGDPPLPPRDGRPALTCLEIEEALEMGVPAFWSRYEGHYGSLYGAWVGTPGRSPEKRLALLVQTAFGAVLQRLDPSFDVDLDFDDVGAATAMLTVALKGVHVTPITVTARQIKVGGEPVALSHPAAGARILRLLMQQVADHLGSPRSVRL